MLDLMKFHFKYLDNETIICELLTIVDFLPLNTGRFIESLQKYK